MPGEPFDLVYARLLLYHLPSGSRAAAPVGCRRPGRPPARPGLRPSHGGVLPTLASVDELIACRRGRFLAAGCDVHVGARLPELFGRAASARLTGPTSPGGSSRSHRRRTSLKACIRALRRGGLARASPTKTAPTRCGSEPTRDAARFPERPLLWPLLISAWRRKSTGVRPGNGMSARPMRSSDPRRGDRRRHHSWTGRSARDGSSTPTTPHQAARCPSSRTTSVSACCRCTRTPTPKRRRPGRTPPRCARRRAGSSTARSAGTTRMPSSSAARARPPRSTR